MTKRKLNMKGNTIRKAYYTVAKPALRYKWVYIALLLINIALIIADLAFAENSRILFDLAPNIAQDNAIRIIILFVGIIIIQFVLGFLNSYTYSYLNESVVYAMRRELLNKVQHMPINFFDLNHSSTVSNIFYHQLESVKNFVVFDFLNIIKLPITFILISAYLFTVHPLLAVTAIVASILQLISNTTFKKSLNETIDNQRRVTGKVFHVMGETVQGIREIKINQVEEFVDSKMIGCQKEGVKYNTRLAKYRTLRGIISEVPMKIGYVFGIAVGIFLMIDQKINPGGLLAFITLLGKVAAPFNGIVRAYSSYQESSQNAQELLSLTQELEEDYKIGEHLDEAIRSIKFNHVSFAYNIMQNDTGQGRKLILPSKTAINTNNNETPHNVLDNIYFEIKGGTTVALVGPSGSGKSTIIKLLYRFYDPNQGTILINKRPINDYRITSIRDNMAIVSQDVFIFDGTIYENIVLGRSNVSEEEVIRALKFSQSYEFIQKLPEGLQTQLGERGVRLSQGQKQRISIARAIVKKARILILDEPTSALDVDTESSFQHDLGIWAEECTKIIIAHRLTTIKDADYVLFLDNGRIIEEGTPYNLIKQNGRFKEYWEKQFLFQQEKANSDNNS